LNTKHLARRKAGYFVAKKGSLPTFCHRVFQALKMAEFFATESRISVASFWWNIPTAFAFAPSLLHLVFPAMRAPERVLPMFSDHWTCGPQI
jgi:hypothetical protein